MIDYSERLKKDELSIFLLHGVIEKQIYKARNYTRKHILQSEFDLFLSQLKSKGTALSIDEAVEYLISKKPFPPHSYTITFDDGFENNLTVAAPVLESHKTPAIFYISTDFVENNSMTWIDQIEYALEKVDQGRLILPWNNHVVEFNNIELKIQLLKKIRHEIKSDSKINTTEAVASIFNQLSLPIIYKNNDPLDKKLNWEQVKILNNHPLFTVGGHSHHHVNLAYLPQTEMKKEIQLSLELINKNIGKCYHYAYPEGLEHCYSQQIIDELKRHKIICSPTAIDGTNPLGADTFHLKRIFVI